MTRSRHLLPFRSVRGDLPQRASGIDRQSQHTLRGAETSWGVLRANGPIEETSVQIDRIALQDVARARLADLIRDTWPSRSDTETARRAAAALGVSDKTVGNWLASTHSAPFDIVFAIACFSGVFRTMDVLTQGQTRFQALNLFARGVRV